MSCYVYILLCKGGSFYTGVTKNVNSRMRLHVNGKGARYTRIHKPDKVVYVEALASRAKAMRRERAIKKMNRSQKIRLIKSLKNQNKTRRSSSKESRYIVAHKTIENLSLASKLDGV
ncbi:MAG TPA: GIY-YIG nuclease family protein [Candidatus Bathyarchaeia archaeon]|nr:GIY-YIG nuclease family protein [Candidatus Bathyarchaeia archaeon]